MESQISLTNLLEERMILSLKPSLTTEDKARLAWINKNLVIPPTEHYKYRSFNIAYYPLDGEWSVYREGTCYYRNSQEEVYRLIDMITDAEQDA